MFNGHTKEVYLSFEGPVFADQVNKRDAYSISASRAKFRNWLIHDIEVNWDHTFDKYEILPDGRVKVHFENGASVEGDILIGADGSQSKGILFFSLSSIKEMRAYCNFDSVRTQLFAATLNAGKPTRLPHACIAGLVHYHSPEAYQHHMRYGPSLYTTDGHGLRVFIGLRKLAEDLSSATLVWLLFWVEQSDEKGAIADGQTANLPRLEALHVATKAEQLAHVKHATKDLHPDFKQIFEDTKEEDMLGSLVVYDRVPVPCPEGPVTLIGDAMHVMTPCRSLDLTMFSKLSIHFLKSEAKEVTKLLLTPLNLLRSFLQQPLVPPKLSTLCYAHSNTR